MEPRGFHSYCNQAPIDDKQWIRVSVTRQIWFPFRYRSFQHIIGSFRQPSGAGAEQNTMRPSVRDAQGLAPRTAVSIFLVITCICESSDVDRVQRRRRLA
jgi:hypothetical protein